MNEMVAVGKDMVITVKAAPEKEKACVWVPAVLSTLLVLGSLAMVCVITYYCARCTINTPGKLYSMRRV